MLSANVALSLQFCLNSTFIFYLRMLFSILQTCFLPARLSGLFDLFLFIFTIENSTDAVGTLCAELQKQNSNFVKQSHYSKLASVILAMLANTCFMQEAEKFFTCCARSCRLSFCLSRISCNRLFMSIIFYREIVPYTNIW